MNHKSTKRTGVLLNAALLASASTLAIGMSATAVRAQDLAANNATEVVVVTGTRASLQTSQSIKQESDQVVDSITAVDIGALPDRNVADALQRVPGVTLQRTDQNRDPVRFGGTGNGIYIRGLAWVQSLTNGRDVFSAANGRALSFADVSADLLSGVDVFKNPDAEMIEGGVGGTVNLKTRKPFDQAGLLIAGSADYTYGTLINTGSPSFNALFSDRWDTPIGEVGLLLSADYQDQRNRTNGYSVTHYDCLDKTGTVSGNSVFGSSACNSIASANRRYIPGVWDWRQIDWRQERLAFDSSAQWRPNDQWEFTAEAFYSKADPHDEEHSLPFNLPQSTTGNPGNTVNYNFDPSGVWTGGTVMNAQTGSADTRIGTHHNYNGDYSLHANFTPNSAWKFSADVQYVESRATNYSMTGFTDMGNPNDSATPGIPGENLTINLTGDIPNASVSNPAAMAVAANWYYSAAMDHLEDNYAHAWSYRADGSFNFEGQNPWLRSIDFGIRGEEKQAITRQTGYNWSELSHLSWDGGSPHPVFLNMTGVGGALSDPNLPNQVSPISYGSFFGNSVPQAWFIKASLLNQGSTSIYNVLKNTETGGWGGMWSPYAVKSNCTNVVDVKCAKIYGGFTPAGDNVSGGINDQRETTFAGYFQVNYGNDDFLGLGIPIDGNFGMRVVQTEDKTQPGVLLLPSSITTACPSPTAPPGTPCTDLATAIQFVGAGGRQALPPVTNTYTDVLPSFNLRAHLTDKLQARLAFSQGIVRPDFTYTQNFQTVGFGFGQSGTAAEGTFDPVTTGRTGSGGNPLLKPMHANNYDVSLEYYFAPTGSLTLAAFHKDLSNYFLTGPVPVRLTNNGVTQTFQVTETVNGSKGKVEGFELGYQQFFDTLPGAFSGLGIAANYTKIYNSGGANPTVNLFEGAQVPNARAPLPLEGMSPDSYNVQLLYEKYGIDGRLAYNWRSRFLLTSSAANVNQPVWSENYGQLDGSVFYSFMEHYKLGIEATNILDSTTILDVGYADFHPRYDWIENDRKISIVLRANW